MTGRRHNFAGQESSEARPAKPALEWFRLANWEVILIRMTLTDTYWGLIVCPLKTRRVVQGPCSSHAVSSKL